MTYLAASTVARWLHCQGSAALAETEEGDDAGPTPDTAELKAAIDARKTALEGAGAKVATPRLVPLDLSVITGERNASAFARAIIIAEWDDHARIEVLGHGDGEEAKLLTFAALMKYALLQNFTETDHWPIEHLYAFGAEVTEAAAVALSVRGDVAALSHLTPGAYCAGCRAAYRCPALKKVSHEAVFGEIQAPDEPKLTPIPVRVRLEPGEELRVGLKRALEVIPLVEAWIASVREQAGIPSRVALSQPNKKAKASKPHKRAKRKSRQGVPARSQPIEEI